jgi:predicted DNA-binding transcriptional regulator AlpA
MHPSTATALHVVLNADASLSEARRTAIMNAARGVEAPATGPHPDRLIRRAEVARRLGVSTRAVDLWTRAGVLTKVRLPGRRRALGFRESDVAGLIATREAA